MNQSNNSNLVFALPKRILESLKSINKLINHAALTMCLSKYITEQLFPLDRATIESLNLVGVLRRNIRPLLNSKHKP